MVYGNERNLYSVAVLAVVYKEGPRFLIIKHSKDKEVLPGKWTLPGGGLCCTDYIDVNQSSEWHPNTLEQALQREMYEEVGLQIGVPHLIYDGVYKKRGAGPEIVLVFVVPWVSGEVALNSEHEDFAWISVKECDKYYCALDTKKEIHLAEEFLRVNN